ncbi:MAG: hypothetical protein M0Z51_14285 [Propionibacterium sp.]|nr:hypothetical protein [Propionibacterium sp.]
MVILGSWRRVAHLLIAVIGIAVMIWGAIALTHPSITCRGVDMHPGDVCATSSFSQVGAGKVQTYEQRLSDARFSQPFVVAIGGVMVGFGVMLLVQDVRRGGISPSAASGRRPAGRRQPE